MKMGMKTVVIASLMAVALTAGNGMAQTKTTPQQQMQGNMMNGGMMGNGAMMNGGMMNGGMMHGGMMGGGMMGGGMMGGGMGCNGMMGGMMMNQMTPQQQQDFMNSTSDLRRQMMEKRFAYMEAARNGKTTPQDLAKIEAEMLTIRSQMMEKMGTVQGK